MTPREEAEECLRQITGEIALAIAISEVVGPMMTGEFVRTANKKYMGGGFGIVRDALHKTLILTLVKLLDDDPSTLSYQRLFRKLSLVWRHENNGRPHQMIDAKKARRALDKHSSLVALRNKVIAHNDIDNPEHGARFGEEVGFLEKSIELVEHVAQALGKSSKPYLKAQTDEWRAHAEDFWRKAIG